MLVAAAYTEFWGNESEKHIFSMAAGGAAAFSDGFPRKAAILDLMKILLKEHAEKPV